MAGVTEITGLIASILGIANTIVELAGKAQRNMEKCSLLREHVENIIPLLTELQSHWTPGPAANSMLNKLEDALNDAKVLVDSCQEKRILSRVFKTQKKAKKFDVLGLRISKILEQFHIANMILIVSINKEHFFMNVLEKLLDDGACKRLQQSEKEELKSSIRRFTDMDNMSAEAKRVLERIIKDIAQGDAEITTSSSARQGEEASIVCAQAVSLADSIVQEAKNLRQNRKEIQQLVHFVQQAADIMQHPQTSVLSQDPLVHNLKQDLQIAYDRLQSYQKNRNANKNRIVQAFRCSVVEEDATLKQILETAYKIEYYVQVLPVIAMRLIYA